MATTVKCDNCGNEIEITEAIRKELEAKILEETQAKHKEALEAKEKEFEEAKTALYEKAQEEADKKASKEFKKRLAQLKEDAEGSEEENKELKEEMKGLLKQLREAKGAKDKLEIEYQKKLLEEEDKIKKDAKKEAEEELGLEIKKKGKQLTDAEKRITELKRQLQQGSQQLQGEVQELAIEDILKKEFPSDDIQEVPKGIKGADVIQAVCNSNGAVCGTIVWESKNAKNWSQSWVQKLKEDQRSLKAEHAVIISKVIPDDINNFTLRDGVWISNMQSAIGLAYALRHHLLNVYAVSIANQGKASKAEIIYNYLISNDFKQRIEVWVDYFKSRREEIDKERAYFTKKWSKEEKNIQKVMDTTAGIYGDLQSLAENALPKVQYLELPGEAKKED